MFFKVWSHIFLVKIKQTLTLFARVIDLILIKGFELLKVILAL